MNEAETCRILVRPKLEQAGWDGNRHFYSEQISFTDGRIVLPAGQPRRLKQKFADFLLRYSRDITLGVVEAKAQDKPAGNGLQQAEEFAEFLNSPLPVKEEPSIYLFNQQRKGDELNDRN